MPLPPPPSRSASTGARTSTRAAWRRRAAPAYTPP
ncbi:hypothetical protein ACP4OV_028818 [Aristida adscensionis]